MEDITLSLNPNPLVKFLKKPQHDFTKADIIEYIIKNNIEMLNFRYVAGDGRLKSLNFVIQSIEHLDGLLSSGERVDGSSLFPCIGAGSSDLYVIPLFRTAFLNTLYEKPAIDILCTYFTKDGEPYSSSPDNVLRKAHKTLKEKTGMSFEAMGELEYYIISDREEHFLAQDQKGYHESEPFTKWEFFRKEAIQLIAQAGGNIKYAHSEVGNFVLEDKMYEQNEIEFLPVDVEDAANQLVIAKWIIRMLAYKYGVTVSFAPKITIGKAGSGLHIHTRLMKDGKNMMIENGKLTDIAKKAIAGYLELSPSLTAFGNINPTSFFRLVPNQEAPTNICWGDRNRSVLVRVPLGWTNDADMVAKVNPKETISNKSFSYKQTVEYRGSDGSADIYLLLATLTTAARHGLEMPNALELAEKTYVDVNIFKEENKEKRAMLSQLPVSCWDAAEQLEKQMPILTRYDVFSNEIINAQIKQLKSHNDKDIRQNIKDEKEMLKLVHRFLHCG